MSYKLSKSEIIGQLVYLKRQAIEENANNANNAFKAAEKEYRGYSDKLNKVSQHPKQSILMDDMKKAVQSVLKKHGRETSISIATDSTGKISFYTHGYDSRKRKPTAAQNDKLNRLSQAVNDSRIACQKAYDLQMSLRRKSDAALKSEIMAQVLANNPEVYNKLKDLSLVIELPAKSAG